MTDTQDKVPGLLPCPFCGGEAMEQPTREPSPGYWVNCPACHAQTDDRGTREVAASAWNRRAISTPPAEPSATWERLSKIIELGTNCGHSMTDGHWKQNLRLSIEDWREIVSVLRATNPIAPVSESELAAVIAKALSTGSVMDAARAILARFGSRLVNDETTASALGGERTTGDLRLVPMEPTDEMLEALWRAMFPNDAMPESDVVLIGTAYAAMLAAAPVMSSNQMKKRQRLFPDQPLGAPKKAFADTFSAETLIMQTFLGETKREAKRAFVDYFAPVTGLWRKLRGR